MKTNLSNLKKGQSGIIVEVNIKNERIKRHILDMGLTKGTRVKIKKIAPSGNPVSLELRDYELAMSKEDLKEILVEVENFNFQKNCKYCKRICEG